MAQPGSLGSLQRILTLMFIDLVGSTEAADSRDLEAYDELLRRFHEHCASLVEEYGGTVVQLYGDGVLACFGLSEDSENAAMAAVACALTIVESIPTVTDGMQARAGVHSGKVVCRVEETGRLLPQVSGLDVNVCARVQAEADRGGVVVTGATMSFLERIAMVDAIDRGPTPLKGVGTPLQIFAVVGYALRAAGVGGYRLFERDDVLQELSRDEPTVDGQPAGVALLVGDPGIGKSAVLGELARRASNELTHVELSARNNLRHTPLFPVAEWLARVLGYGHFPILGEHSRSDLEERVCTILPDFPRERILALSDVLGIDDSSQLYASYSAAQIRTMRVGAVLAFVKAFMAQQRSLLTFDDFQWLDEDSRVLVDRLLDDGVPSGSRVVIGSRPYRALFEYAQWRGLPVVRLNPLSADAARSLLNDAGLETMTTTHQERIVALAEGNPLFLKTMLNLLSRSEAGLDRLPPTIDATFQGVINSFEDSKELMLLASIIGRTFTMNELRYMTDDQMNFTPRFGELVRGGLLEAGQSYWRFSHILLQEAAYNMMPVSRRRALHKRFADMLSANEPQRAREYPEILADHYLASGDTRSIARSCLEAGLKFLRRTNYERSQHYLEKSVEAMKESGDDDRLLSALTPLSAAKLQRYGFMHPETLSGYRALESAVRDSAEHRHERIQALNNVFAQRVMSGYVRAACGPLDDIAAVRDPADDWEGVMFYMAECAYRLYSGSFDEALVAAQNLKARYRQEEHGTIFLHTGSDPLVGVCTAQANVHALRNELGEAVSAFDDARSHLESVGAELQKPWVLIFTGSPLVYTPGAETLSLERIEAGIAIADAQGSGFWSMNGRLWRSVIASERGQPATGELELTSLLAQEEAAGIGLNRPFFLSVRAQDLHRDGRSQEARELAVRATRMAALMGQRQWIAEIWRKRAAIHWDLDEPQQARRSWRIALAYARRSKAAVWEARCLEDLRQRGVSIEL